jgi:hypothetical protein
MTLKEDCMDIQHMIFRTCTVLSLGETEGTCSISSLKRIENCAKFQSGNSKLVCLVLYSSVAKYISYMKKNENDV